MKPSARLLIVEMVLPPGDAMHPGKVLVPWLMLNRHGLNILVHPRTGDEMADHTENPLWLGAPVQLDLEFIRRHTGAGVGRRTPHLASG